MRYEQCPTCGHKGIAGQIRCLRCNTLLLQPCSGSCRKCKEKNTCDHEQRKTTR